MIIQGIIGIFRTFKSLIMIIGIPIVMITAGLALVLSFVAVINILAPLFVVGLIVYFAYSFHPKIRCRSERIRELRIRRRQIHLAIQARERRLRDSPYRRIYVGTSTDNGLCIDGWAWVYDEKKAAEISKRKLDNELNRRNDWLLKQEAKQNLDLKEDLKKRIIEIAEEEFLRKHGWNGDTILPPGPEDGNNPPNT